MFEENVEEIRHLVLSTNRKLRMSEVETFTETLTKIGRNAAKLKSLHIYYFFHYHLLIIKIN